MIRDIVVALLVVGAIFFGVMPHRVHCDTLKGLVKNCPAHWVHILSGVVLFLLAVLVSQWGYINSSLSKCFKSM